MKDQRLHSLIHDGIFAFVLSLSFGVACSGKAAGRIVVAHDDLVLADTGFHAPSDPGIFAKNLASLFTGGRAGRFLAYSDSQGLTGTSLINAMVSEGHTWVVSTSASLELSNLMTFDGIFLCGHPVASEVLSNYVSAGGNVYLAGVGVASDDTSKWNPFLQQFGLAFTDIGTGVADFPVTSTHPMFEGVDHLYGVNGTALVDLQPTNPRNRVLVSNSGMGLFAVWEPKETRLRIRVSQVELSWESESNVNYMVEYRSSVTGGSWLPLDTNCVPGDGSIKNIYDSVLLGEPRRFYRLSTNCVPQP